MMFHFYAIIADRFRFVYRKLEPPNRLVSTENLRCVFECILVPLDTWLAINSRLAPLDLSWRSRDSLSKAGNGAGAFV